MSTGGVDIPLPREQAKAFAYKLMDLPVAAERTRAHSSQKHRHNLQVDCILCFLQTLPDDLWDEARQS